MNDIPIFLGQVFTVVGSLPFCWAYHVDSFCMCDMPCLLILRLVLVLLSPLFGGKEWQRPRLQTHFTTTKVHVMPGTARLGSPCLPIATYMYTFIYRAYFFQIKCKCICNLIHYISSFMKTNKYIYIHMTISKIKILRIHVIYIYIYI